MTAGFIFRARARESPCCDTATANSIAALPNADMWIDVFFIVHKNDKRENESVSLSKSPLFCYIITGSEPLSLQELSLIHQNRPMSSETSAASYRSEQILEELLRHGEVSVDSLARHFSVSAATIRRDLSELER